MDAFVHVVKYSLKENSWFSKKKKKNFNFSHSPFQMLWFKSYLKYCVYGFNACEHDHKVEIIGGKHATLMLIYFDAKLFIYLFFIHNNTSYIQLRQKGRISAQFTAPSWIKLKH